MILFFSLKKNFAVSGKVTLQSSMELINYQPAKGVGIAELEAKRTWLTNVADVQQELKKKL